MEEPLCCDCAPGKCPFIKIKDRTQPRKAHEGPLMSDLPSLLRPVAALSLCALAPLTTTHRQCLEQLGIRAGGLSPRCAPSPLPSCALHAPNGHAHGQTAICPKPQPLLLLLRWCPQIDLPRVGSRLTGPSNQLKPVEGDENWSPCRRLRRRSEK